MAQSKRNIDILERSNDREHKNRWQLYGKMQTYMLYLETGKLLNFSEHKCFVYFTPVTNGYN